MRQFSGSAGNEHCISKNTYVNSYTCFGNITRISKNTYVPECTVEDGLVEVCTITCHYMNLYIQMYMYSLKYKVVICSVLLVILDKIKIIPTE